MNIEQMAVEIEKLVVEKGGGVSMAELENGIEGFRGNLAWGALDRNVVFWVNMSDAAVNALALLFKAKKLKLKPTELLVYMVDGNILNLPIAKRPDHTYKKEHWLPVVLNLPTQSGAFVIDHK